MLVSIKELDIVALLSDLPGEGLRAGQAGTVVFVHAGVEAYEVEFPLEPRRSVVATISPSQVLKLHGLPVSTTASET
jgi:hypothetical protein